MAVDDGRAGEQDEAPAKRQTFGRRLDHLQRQSGAERPAAVAVGPPAGIHHEGRVRDDEVERALHALQHVAVDRMHVRYAREPGIDARCAQGRGVDVDEDDLGLGQPLGNEDARRARAAADIDDPPRGRLALACPLFEMSENGLGVAHGIGAEEHGIGRERRVGRVQEQFVVEAR